MTKQTPVANSVGKPGSVGDDTILLALSAAIAGAGLVTRNGKLQRTGARMLVAQLVARTVKGLGERRRDRSLPAAQQGTEATGPVMGAPGNIPRQSAPSGRTASALAVARAFSREYSGLAKPLLAAAAIVGALQAPRRAKNPSDVAAGAGAGLVAEKLADLLIAGVEKRRNKRRMRKARHRR